MLKRLQHKWKVGPGRLLLILLTFATGGSLTGWLGRRVMGLFSMGDSAFYIPVYIVLVTLIWPLMVLLVSIPFGQFPFFRSYLAALGRKIGARLRGRKEKQKGKEEVQGEKMRAGSSGSA